MLQDDDGQISDSWSISAGLDYPAVGPEHAHLKDIGRADYVGCEDGAALDAFVALARSRGDRRRVRKLPRAGACAQAGRGARRPADPARQPVGARRQGHDAGAASARRPRMSRYAAMFERCAAAGEGAFGAFLMLGDPDLETSATLLDALVEGGADMVELGIPFSDPVADGPVIQAAAQRALAAGVRTRHCLDLIAAFRVAPRRRPDRHPDLRQHRRSARDRGLLRRTGRGRGRQPARRRRAQPRGRALRRGGARGGDRPRHDRRAQHAARHAGARSRRCRRATPIASRAPG